MAVDLSVNLGGVKLKNPFVVASADIGGHLGQVKEAAGYGAGAFILKGCIPRSGAVGLTRRGRFRVDLKRNTLSGFAGCRRLSLDDAKKLLINAKKEVNIPIGVNVFVMAPSPDEKEVVTNASKVLAEAGADFIELDTTGNLPVHFGETEKEGKTGEYFVDEVAANYPKFVYEVTKSVKKVVGSTPVMGKIAYENLNVPALVNAMEAGGADMLDCGNVALAMTPGITDINNPNKPWGGFVSCDKTLALNLMGEPLKLTAQGYILRTAKSAKKPILGTGGIVKWQDVVEHIMCGATATAACTIFMVRGFEVIKKWDEGLRKFMEEKGYKSVSEFRGLFLKHLALTFTEVNVKNVIAKIDPEKCTGCGLCLKPAHCGINWRAISMKDNVAVVNPAECIGCETCQSICPVNAVELVLQD